MRQGIGHLPFGRVSTEMAVWSNRTMVCPHLGPGPGERGREALQRGQVQSRGAFRFRLSLRFLVVLVLVPSLGCVQLLDLVLVPLSFSTLGIICQEQAGQPVLVSGLLDLAGPGGHCIGRQQLCENAQKCMKGRGLVSFPRQSKTPSCTTWQNLRPISDTLVIGIPLHLWRPFS